MKKFSIKEAIKFGWAKMKPNFLFFASVLTAATVVSFVFGKEGFLLSAAGMIAQMFIGLGVVKNSLDIVDGKKFQYKSFYSEYKRFFDYFFGCIIYGLVVVAGLVLFIVPGIIFAIKYQFFPYFVVDKGFSALKALEHSSKITKGEKWDLFLFYLANIGINIIGIFAFVVGMFATAPTTILASAHVYRKLESHLRHN